ncbi:NAD(P)H-dependent oxidoreductase [Gymnodinialimonas sp. 2305UL16-5]|uniref:FMN-dependent NADH-azoreductase n=1 Tax=Gymnodinialimonas mytili TaxID=3126503 RepID=UPI0030B79ACB
MTTHLLRVDASARRTGSITRDLTDRIIAKLNADAVTTRDLAESLPHVSEAWIGANFTPADQRSAEQREILSGSDALVDEVIAADMLVIGVPIYHFSVPTALKAWIDMVARVGRTFQYTDTGPKGLLTGKRAILAVASGGTEAGSEIDFATGYMRHVLGFIGITDVQIISADQMAVDPDATLAKAHAEVAALAA